MSWEDPEDWGGWNICEWEAMHSDLGTGWACLLPLNHTGPHFGPAGWETEPYHEDNRIERNGVWVQGDMCFYCNRRHPGFRHANEKDPIVVQFNAVEVLWEPLPNPFHNANTLVERPLWSELFIPILEPFRTLPKPPKFNSIEEADAWLEANA